MHRSQNSHTIFEKRKCYLFIAELTHWGQETLLKSFTKVWEFGQVLRVRENRVACNTGEENSGWRILELGQFWIRLWGKRTHKVIVIWQCLLGGFGICSWSAWALDLPYGRTYHFIKGSWGHFCYVILVDWRFLLLGSFWGLGWHMCSIVFVNNSRIALITNQFSGSRASVLFHRHSLLSIWPLGQLYHSFSFFFKIILLSICWGCYKH